jgi:preprotein translocase subunit SecG
LVLLEFPEMQFLITLVLVVQMLSAVAMIGLVLVQHGKGADMGASFGSGASGSLFGATGSANFLSRTTAVLAAVFFACTLALAYIGSQRGSVGGTSILERAAPAAASAASAVPIAPAASVALPLTPTPAASGAEQIPTR